jgi:integrase
VDGTAGALTAPVIDGSVLASELDQIEAQAAAFARAARAPATRRAYASDWADFTAWCRRAGLLALPATPRTVGSYLAARTADLRVSTLQRRLAAIAASHRLAGHPLDRRDPAIGALLAGIKRVKGTRPDTKTPLLTGALRQVLRKLPADNLIGSRDRAILLIGFAGAFRRSELAGLDRGDVDIGPAGADIVIRHSKTDPTGLGQRVCIPRSRRSVTCPVAALEAWISAALISSGPIFTALDRGHTGARLSGAAIAQVIKRAVAADGLDPTLYGGHSLRAGFATSAARGGADLLAIAAQTRHRSLEVARRYVRDQAAASLASRASRATGL